MHQGLYSKHHNNYETNILKTTFILMSFNFRILRCSNIFHVHSYTSPCQH